MKDVTKMKKLELMVKSLKEELRLTPKPRRDYKSSVFAMLFADPKEALALYNAVSGKNYTNPKKLRITTLSNAIYLDMKNDISFLIDARLCMVEHQATVNPNMPLRDLFYVSRQYEKLYGDEKIYLSTPKKISAPFFVTIYNGKEKQPERRVMRLSELYEYQPVEEEPSLELKVLQLNINPGYNEGLKDRCKILGEYTMFIERIRAKEKSFPLAEAVEMAIDECIEEGILEEFLRNQKREVQRMILFEYDKKKYKKYLKEEARAEGLAEGRAEGRAKGRAEGRAEGEAKMQALVFCNMLSDGIPKERAQRLTGLDDEAAEMLVREKNRYMSE